MARHHEEIMTLNPDLYPHSFAARLGHFVRSTWSSKYLGDWLSAIEEDRQLREKVVAGRLMGLTILQWQAKGQPMDIVDNQGVVTGNMWEEFRALPSSVTYETMGFNQDQVDAL